MKETKKVLMLRSSIGVFGAERVILELAKGLAKSRFEPVVGVLENRNKLWAELATTTEKMGVPAHRFSCRRPFDLRTVIAIRNYIKRHKIDIVHAHGYKANFYALLASAFNGAASMATCHPWTETGYSYKARFYTFLDRAWLRKMDAIVAISDEVKHQLSGMNYKRQIDVISNGIDPDHFNGSTNGLKVRQSLGFSKSDIIIGTIGRLVPEKGYAFLIESVKSICKRRSTTKMIFVGDGPMRNLLEQEAINLNLQKNIRFLGIRKDVPALLASMDIFVLSSTSEGVPMVLLEAMAAGKPIIATSVGAIPRILRHNVTGLLVPPKDSKALTNAFEVFLSEEKRAKRMALAAKKEVAAHYSAWQMAEKYMKQYEKLISESE